MKKLLVTGASGFLGWHLCQLAQSQWQLYGTYHTHPSEVPGVTLLPLDLTDYQAIKQVMQTVQPDAVLHIAALSSPNACQSEPDLSYRINVVSSWELAGLCAEAGIPCVFTSSEQVFDGLNPPYRETDPVCPINRYGEHKVAAEVGMQERCPGVVICRMPLMFGAAPTASSFIQPWIKMLRAGQSINLFTDEIRNPVSGMDAAQGIFLALANVKGIIHLGGIERLSRYQLGCILAEVLQLPIDQLNPCRQADVQMAAPRPPDASLNSELAYSLGYQPKGFKDALLALQAEL
ncbi:MAG: SDR family oxidoreductase [Leptolyngbya sp. IPPAS B-1204]|nr:SDR family oxidoreductase [Elainella sp. C42_A2020_010]RNJ65159.1 MAG: SDR family oxidoreductase [Leptolyngbya sp. IPPAS B-1204]